MILYTTETATIYNACLQDSKKEAKKNIPPRAGDYNGFLSKKTARTVTRRIGNLLEIAEAGNRLVTFVTLTLPSIQKHSDDYIRRFLLNDFLRILKEKYSVVNYLWKAEAQQNNNIHFHLLCDNYLENRRIGLEAGEINKVWNHILNRFGYIEPYRQKMINKYLAGEIEPEKQAYYLYNDFSQPPSTQVKALEKKERPESYINKYIGKAEPNKRIIMGKIVGCSDSLKKACSFTTNEERFEEYNALAKMAKENPEKCTRIAIVIEAEKPEKLPEINFIKTFFNPSIEEKENYAKKYQTENEPEPPTNEPKKKKLQKNTVVKKNFTEKINDTILCVKYYYTAKLWKQYSPPSHKVARKKHFEDLALLHYFGVLNE